MVAFLFFIVSIATVIGTPVGIASTSLSLAFSLSTRNNEKKHNKIVMLAISKLNRIERKIPQSLMNNQISHEDFMIIINKEGNYRESKESIRLMKGQENKKKTDID